MHLTEIEEEIEAITARHFVVIVTNVAISASAVDYPCVRGEPTLESPSGVTIGLSVKLSLTTQVANVNNLIQVREVEVYGFQKSEVI